MPPLPPSLLRLLLTYLLTYLLTSLALPWFAFCKTALACDLRGRALPPASGLEALVLGIGSTV